MSIAELSLLAVAAWVGFDAAIVGGWLAVVAIARRCRPAALAAPIIPLPAGLVALRGHRGR